MTTIEIERPFYYECHVTFMGEESLREVVKLARWKFSKIDGDPTLGDGVKMYATRQYKGVDSIETVIQRLEATAKHLEHSGAKVLRSKVELVVYDHRRKKG